jgi:hypothetical protein
MDSDHVDTIEKLCNQGKQAWQSQANLGWMCILKLQRGRNDEPYCTLVAETAEKVQKYVSCTRVQEQFGHTYIPRKDGC